jgi:hypothetical protein
LLENTDVDDLQKTSLLEVAQAAIATQRQQGVRGAEPIQLCMVGESLMKLGRIEDARVAFAHSLACGRETGERWWEAETQRQLGLLHERAYNDTTKALEHFHLALDVARAQGAHLLVQRCLINIHRLLGD